MPLRFRQRVVRRGSVSTDRSVGCWSVIAHRSQCCTDGRCNYCTRHNAVQMDAAITAQVTMLYRWTLQLLHTSQCCTDGRCNYCTLHNAVQMDAAITAQVTMLYRWTLQLLHRSQCCTDGRCNYCTRHNAVQMVAAIIISPKSLHIMSFPLFSL